MQQTDRSVQHCCGLCETRSASLVHQHPKRPITGRRFYQCASCGLIQVAQNDRLTPDEEKALYDIHNNSPDDPGYRKFLQQLTTPLVTLLAGKTSAAGLDFGSGPGPALSEMLREQGFQCADYDIFYANAPQRLMTQYDFITSTEVFEHLANPADVLDTLMRCLKPGGLLGIMMQRPDEQANFASWGYIKDPTHISFYTNQALEYISDRWSLKECYRDRNVIIWQANADERAPPLA